MDLAVLIILIVLVFILFKDIKWITYLIGIVEIFLRLIHYIGDKLGVIEFNKLVNNYLPNSIFSILKKYSSGLIYDILSWILVVILVGFLCYLIKYFFKQK